MKYIKPLEVLIDVKEPPTKDLVKLIQHIKNMLRSKDYIGVDGILLHLPLESLDPVVMVILIRTTSCCKSALIYWQLAAQNICDELDDRKLNVKELMRGL